MNASPNEQHGAGAGTEQGSLPAGLAMEDEAMLRELERMTEAMALALARLECPDCCGPTHAFIEAGASLHREEFEWACLVQIVRRSPSR